MFSGKGFHMINKQLLNEIEISHLIYCKFQNQQRTQKWWRYFAMIDRRLIRFVQHNEVDPVSAQFIVNKLIPKAARAFHGILRQGAFITLGFALIALVAKIRTLLLPFSEQIASKKEKKVKKEHKPLLPSEDLGEVIGDLGEDIGEEVAIEKPRKHESFKKHKLKEKAGSDKKKKKKDKKKSSSAIDDIFG